MSEGDLKVTWRELFPRETYESTLKYKHTVTVIDVDVPNWELQKNPMGYEEVLRRVFESKSLIVEDIPEWNELRERFVKSCEEMKEYYEGGKRDE